MLSSVLISVVILALICWVIYAYLIPILPPPFNTIAYVVLVIVVIVWLLRLLEPGLLLGFNEGITYSHYATLTGNDVYL